MIKRLEITDPASCLSKAAPDEPVFVLRAKDPLASFVVRFWAEEARGYHHEESKIAEALRLADQMDEWRQAQQGP